MAATVMTFRGGAVRRVLTHSVVHSAACLFLFASAAAGADSLDFFKNYFVTGDYAVGGAGTQGKGVRDTETRSFILQKAPAKLALTTYADSFATASISVAVPNHASGAAPEIVAAFLYWASIESTAAPSSFLGTFRAAGQTGSTTKLIIGKTIGRDRTAPCWSSGGGTGGASGGPVLRVYRADVLRELPIVNGKRQASGPFEVKLPDTGSTGNKLPLTQGASLVVVYRYPQQAAAGHHIPLKAVVLYDGTFTMDQSAPEFSQSIRGFYQASSAPVAKMTHIVGGGQANFTEQLSFNNTILSSPNPFTGALGGSWDNVTFENLGTQVGAGASSAAVNVRGVPGSGSFDCLSWGALVFSTTVQDQDNDSLLDVWESAGGFKELLPNNSDGATVPLPDAHVTQKDVYIQIGFLKGTDGHSHLPKQAALDMVYYAFQQAPGGPIHVHFDVGKYYQDTPPAPPVQARSTQPFDPAIVPASAALGGQIMIESACDPAKVETHVCTFANVAGVVGWQSGFQVLRDVTGAVDPNTGAPVSFPAGRRHAYRYGLFAHALGIETSKGSGVPRSVSGVAALGADFMVTLGLWRSDNPADDQTGSALVQAGTLMHEFGHTLGLHHGGHEKAPNCKPNYQSVMNYLFQVRGLAGGPLGLQVDYSDRILPAVNESSLSDQGGIGASKYAARWYAPLSALDQRLASTGNRAATRYCDGSLVTNGTKMVRVDATTVGGNIAWDGDNLLEFGYLQDVNFNGGPADPAFAGSNDWASLDLRQIGARSNMLGLSSGTTASDVSTADPVHGTLELGTLELGTLELGTLELGTLELGTLELGTLELGTLELGEIDFESASSVVDPPTGLTGAAVGRDVRLNWTAPGFGQIRKYGIWRMPSSAGRTEFGLIDTVSGVPPQTFYTDTSVRNNTTYQYFVTAYDGTGNQSSASPIVTVVR